jgi:hypothetical protein
MLIVIKAEGLYWIFAIFAQCPWGLEAEYLAGGTNLMT